VGSHRGDHFHSSIPSSKNRELVMAIFLCFCRRMKDGSRLPWLPPYLIALLLDAEVSRPFEPSMHSMLLT
jgi:hypothetical protein